MPGLLCAGASRACACGPRSARDAGPGLEFKQVEGEQHGLSLDRPVVTQPVKNRDAVLAADHDLAVDQTRAAGERGDRGRDRRVAPRPVEAVAGQQADAGGVAPCHQPKAVELDLVQPAGTVGRLLGGRWQAGSMKPGGVRRVRDNMRKPNNRPTSASRIRARGDASEWVFSRPPPAS